jgi:hypothetical protein
LTALDVCDGEIVVDPVETQTNPGSSCNNVITRTWTATDECGNTATCKQTITVNDDQDPSITCPPDEDFVTLAELNAYLAAYPDGSAAAIAQVTADDNCDLDVEVTSTGPQTDNGATGCGDDVRTITRTYRATDDCGNWAECTQTITLRIEPPACDITAPDEVCLYTAGNKASVVPVAGASYLWTIDNGVITAGQGTDTITWTSGAPGETSITVTVTAPESEGGCKSTCPLTVGISECETCNTAWGYLDSAGTPVCLYKLNDRRAQNWGWYTATNAATLTTSGISGEMWAANPNCAPGIGYDIGAVTVTGTLSADGKTIAALTVSYPDSIPGDCRQEDLQVWASTSDPTRTKGKSAWYKGIEPGVEFTLANPLPATGTVYIAVHDIVCCSTCANPDGTLTGLKSWLTSGQRT